MEIAFSEETITMQTNDRAIRQRYGQARRRSRK
jgi:hypothetical protein